MQTTRHAGRQTRATTGRIARAAGVEVDRLEGRQLMAAHVAGGTVAYATIQAAVNAAPAGGTVTVDAGSYAETVAVNKPLTILGAQAGVDARGNARGRTGARPS